jgi:uncharacterized protein
MLVARQRELEELNALIRKPAARLLAVSGRRRLGKTTLLTHWARAGDFPYLYWVASRFPSAILLGQLSREVWHLNNPDKTAPRTFSYDNWAEVFAALAEACQGPQKHIVILDEFPYAVEAEPGITSALQTAWDQHLKHSNICLVLCGSHVGMMERLSRADAPLYGRILDPLRIRPLPFTAVSAFLPSYTAEQRVAVYAVSGGVPAYLEQFSDDLSLLDNLREQLFRETSLFRTDPDYLIGEQVRDLKNYQAVLAAIAGGARRPSDIAAQATMPHRSSADIYLAQLTEMDYVRRELPVTIEPEKRPFSRQSRYVISDNYLHFYFCFVHPNLSLLAQRLHEQVEKEIAGQLQAFAGKTTFETLCRQWLLCQAQAGKLPFPVAEVGSHWGGGVQVAVVAIDWREKAISLGDTGWQSGTVEPVVIRELVEQKTPKVLKALPDEGQGWQVHYAFFARAGFTEAARVEATAVDALLVDLARLDCDLAG